MQESVMQRMWDSAHLSGGNAAYVEELYELYLHDPNAVPEEWRTYFQKLPPTAAPLPMYRTRRSATISYCWQRTSAAPNRFPPGA
jgi:2-oxoglutarate dehydrogenase E1 component (EC 1.2.4.2)